MVEQRRPGLISPEMQEEIKKLRADMAEKSGSNYRIFLERISNRDIKGRRDSFSGLAPEQEKFIRALEKENKMYFTPDEIRKFKTTVNARNNYNRMAKEFGSIVNDPELRARHASDIKDKEKSAKSIEREVAREKH